MNPSLVGILLWALLPGFIAKNKGRSFWAYFLLSLVITPLITTIITLCLSRISNDNNTPADSNTPNQETSSVPAASDPTLLQAEVSSTDPVPLVIDTTAEDATINSIDRSIPQELPIVRRIQYCRRCGFKLLDDSAFCSNCGNEIEKEGAV